MFGRRTFQAWGDVRAGARAGDCWDAQRSSRYSMVWNDLRPSGSELNRCLNQEESVKKSSGSAWAHWENMYCGYVKIRLEESRPVPTYDWIDGGADTEGLFCVRFCGTDCIRSPDDAVVLQCLLPALMVDKECGWRVLWIFLHSCIIRIDRGFREVVRQVKLEMPRFERWPPYLDSHLGRKIREYCKGIKLVYVSGQNRVTRWALEVGGWQRLPKCIVLDERLQVAFCFITELLRVLLAFVSFPFEDVEQVARTYRVWRCPFTIVTVGILTSDPRGWGWWDRGLKWLWSCLGQDSESRSTLTWVEVVGRCRESDAKDRLRRIHIYFIGKVSKQLASSPDHGVSIPRFALLSLFAQFLKLCDNVNVTCQSAL
jgi:hypothetical protein